MLVMETGHRFILYTYEIKNSYLNLVSEACPKAQGMLKG